MNGSSRENVWLSWSSGKDSYAALRALHADGRYKVGSLFTVVDRVMDRIPMHDVSIDLLAKQVGALGVRHRLVSLNDEDQAEGIEKLLDEARNNQVHCFAFGDLFLDNIRSSREEKMAGSGIGTVFPLWHRPTKSLILDLIGGGMRAIITSVDLAALPESFLGRELTADLVDELGQRGCDPCGEHGEYHSFVFDGPLFDHPVYFEPKEPRVGKNFAHLPLLPGDPIPTQHA